MHYTTNGSTLQQIITARGAALIRGSPCVRLMLFDDLATCISNGRSEHRYNLDGAGLRGYGIPVSDSNRTGGLAELDSTWPAHVGG